MKRENSGYLHLAIMFIFIAIAYSLCYSTIKARQQAYESTYSNELLENYYADCSTDSECEQLESELNFDFRKGMN